MARSFESTARIKRLMAAASYGAMV